MGLTQIKDQFLQKTGAYGRIKIYLTLAALCMALLILMRPSKQKEPSVPQAEALLPDTQSYSDKLEKSLEDIISQIQGVGNVKVMVTVDGSIKSIYVADESTSDSKSDEKTVIIGSKEALLEGTKYPEVKGVLVVCSGGKSAAVKEKVVNAVSTVLDIPTSKVCVTNAK